jgi:hypothetical protein
LGRGRGPTTRIPIAHRAFRLAALISKMLRTLEDIFGLGHLGASAAAADMLAR